LLGAPSHHDEQNEGDPAVEPGELEVRVPGVYVHHAKLTVPFRFTARVPPGEGQKERKGGDRERGEQVCVVVSGSACVRRSKSVTGNLALIIPGDGGKGSEARGGRVDSACAWVV